MTLVAARREWLESMVTLGMIVGNSVVFLGEVAMAGRTVWLWPIAVSVTVSVAGAAVNIATEFKTSGLAWVCVLVATVAAGVMTVWAQQATSGTRVGKQALTLGGVGCVAAVVLGIFAVMGAAYTAAVRRVVSHRRQGRPRHRSVRSRRAGPVG